MLSLPLPKAASLTPFLHEAPAQICSVKYLTTPPTLLVFLSAAPSAISAQVFPFGVSWPRSMGLDTLGKQILIFPRPQSKNGFLEHPSGSFCTSPSGTWMLYCLGPMPQSLAWPLVSSPGISTRPCMSVTNSRRALCSSTPTTRQMWPHPSEDSNSQDLAKIWVTKPCPGATFIYSLSKHPPKATKCQVLSPVLGCHIGQDSW